ncbi:MAG: DUF123 domain-containing protein [Promethearchaeota archaeon]
MKGTYNIVIFLKENSKIQIGSLGKIFFSKGYYLYVGSAMGISGSATLINRVRRHLRNSNNKKLHWHIDYFLANSNSIIKKLYLIPSQHPYECIIAQEIFVNADDYIKNFGSSDCQCKSHLFYFKRFSIFNSHFLGENI